jgi:DNA mismatch repair protein MutL
MKTKQDQEGCVIVEGSKFVSQDMAVLPKGTSFAVKSLFSIRRNFFKSDTVEYRHIIDEFQRVALAHQISISLFFHNGSEMFNLPPSSMRQQLLVSFWQNDWFRCKRNRDRYDSWIIGKPEFAKKQRRTVFLCQ